MPKTKPITGLHTLSFMVYFMHEDGVIHNQYIGNVSSEQRAIELARTYEPKSATIYKIEQL